MRFESESEADSRGENAQEAGERDLQVYLLMAGTRLRKQIEGLQETDGFSDRVRTMRMLEELIREQTPNENTGSSTGTAR